MNIIKQILDMCGLDEKQAAEQLGKTVPNVVSNCNYYRPTPKTVSQYTELASKYGIEVDVQWANDGVPFIKQ